MTALLTDTITALGPYGTLALFVFLLLFAGIVLPAVWSRHAYRRTAARRILTAMADFAARLLRRAAR